MATHRLFENAGTPSRNASTLASIQNYATRFTVAQDGWLTELSWYRAQASPDPEAPTSLRLYTSGGTLVYFAGSIPDNGGVGWQRHVLTDNVPLVAGLTYEAAACFPVGNHQTYFATTPAAPSAILAFTTPPRYFNTGACDFPNSTNAGTDLTAVEAQWSDTGPDPDALPPTSQDLANLFASWLSVDDVTHADSAPVQALATLTTVDANVTAVEDQQNEWAFGLGAAAHGYYETIRGLINTIKNNTDALPDDVADIVDALADHLDSEIDGILSAIDGVLSGLGAQTTDLSGTAGSAVGALSGRTGFPSAGWSMSAETDFDTEVAFAEPADLYVVTVTTPAPTMAADSFAGLTYYYRLGSWTVMDGDQGSGRQFVEFSPQQLHDHGRRMPGCAIRLKPGTLANVQAWLLA